MATPICGVKKCNNPAPDGTVESWRSGKLEYLTHLCNTCYEQMLYNGDRLTLKEQYITRNNNIRHRTLG